MGVASARREGQLVVKVIRALAEELLINPNTVSRAYRELAREGVLESRPGKGMFISKRRQIYSKPERKRVM
jgi:GntR family transcriptional regulator